MAGTTARLTPRQEARLAEFAQQWTQIGLVTHPADRSRAEAAIRDMYLCAGLAVPKTIVWCGSPLTMGLSRAINLRADQGNIIAAQVPEEVRAKLRSSVADGAGLDAGYCFQAHVEHNILIEVQSNVRASVGKDVWDDVMANIRDEVGAGVWGVGVRNDLGADISLPDRNVRAHVSESFRAIADAQRSAPILGSYRFFHDVVALREQTEKLAGLWALAQSADSVLPHQNICWVSERHHTLKLDDDADLHSLEGPACAYPDGFAIYAVHGVRVPSFVVERPREVTVEKIDAEQNAEVRRIMINRYREGEEIHGAAAFLRDAGGRKIDHDDKFGTLWRREIPDDEPIVLLEVVNATPEPDGRFKHYWLRVPPSMTSAREAAAWTFELGPDEYTPEKET